MPKMKVVNGKKVRDYTNQAKYNATPTATAKRVKNNSARRMAIEAGKARVGDGKDVDHKKPLSKGGTNAASNLQVVDRSKNRSFARTSTSKLKSQTSKKERKRG